MTRTLTVFVLATTAAVACQTTSQGTPRKQSSVALFERPPCRHASFTPEDRSEKKLPAIAISGGTIHPPRMLERVEPDLPPAWAGSPRGVVSVQVVIDEKGRVRAPCVVAGLGDAVDKTVVSAVLQWRYEPIRYRGVTLPVIMRIDVRVPDDKGGKVTGRQ